MTYASCRTLLLFVLACVLSACQQAAAPNNPNTPPPETVPDETVVTGTFVSWDSGEAFVTLPGGGLSFSVTYDGSSEEVTFRDLEMVPPLFQGAVAADGSFSVTLRDPDPSELQPLGCTPDGPNVAAVGTAVASTVATPASGNDVIGIYSYADSGTVERYAGWLYVAEPYMAEETCTSDEQGFTSRIDLDLEVGWNEVMSTIDESGSLLTSEPIPDSFEWVDAFTFTD